VHWLVCGTVPRQCAPCGSRGIYSRSSLSTWIGGSTSRDLLRHAVQVEFDPNSASNTVRGWLHVQNGGSSGQGQVELVSDVNANQWFVVTAERVPGKSYRWYVNGKLYKQVLAPGLTPKPEEAGVTKVLASPIHRSAGLPPLADSVRVQGHIPDQRRDRGC
jgi:hypothetical protein